MRIIIKPGMAILIVVVLFGLFASLALRNRTASRLQASSAAPTPPSGHLVAQWTLDEATGTMASNSEPSGSDNSGKLYGDAKWAAGHVGSHCLDLPATSPSFVEIPRPVVDTTRSFTVTTHVKLRRVEGFQTFVSIDGERVSGFYLQSRDNGKLSFAFLPQDDPGNNNPAVAGATNLAQLDRWYHLAGVYNAEAQTISLYIDGALQQTTPMTTHWRATGHTLIGRGKFDGNAVDYIDGQMDDVRFYEGVLSPQEIQAQAKAGIG